MAANVALSRVNATVRRFGADDQQLERVSAVVRNGRGVLRQGQQVVAEKDDVTESRLLGRTHWLITFADGTTWELKKPPCAPCGRT